MNQNRNNNRRRGRGNNRGQGGGHQVNRIDSRARGNAPQLLEKYRKLAHDASLNGDRVQTEYYLQFADHYFRVIADNKAQKEESRPRRDVDEGDEGDDFDEFDTAPRSQPSRSRQDNSQDEESGEEPARQEEDDAEQEPNPFIRQTRTRQPRSPRGREKGANGTARQRDAQPEGEAAPEAGFDPGVLPPSIVRGDEESVAPKPARGRRRAKPADDGDKETLEAVN